jgi:5'-nucleotidase
MSLLALVDLDGTLADFDGAMRRELTAILGPHEDAKWIDAHEEEHAWLKGRRRLIKAKPGFWKNLEPLANGMIVVEELTRAGFDLMVLTRAPKDVPLAWQEKVEWCMRFLPGVPVTITPQKELVYGKVLVDDWPEYFVPWMRHRPRGLVVVPAQRWNEKHETSSQLLRFTGREDVEALRERLERIKAETR